MSNLPPGFQRINWTDPMRAAACWTRCRVSIKKNVYQVKESLYWYSSDCCLHNHCYINSRLIYWASTRWCDNVKIHSTAEHCPLFYRDEQEGWIGNTETIVQTVERESKSFSAGKHPSSWSICGQISSACQVVPESQFWPPREATDTRNKEQRNFSHQFHVCCVIKFFLILYSYVIKHGSPLE